MAGGKKEANFESNYRSIQVYKQRKATDALKDILLEASVYKNALTNRCHTVKNSDKSLRELGITAVFVHFNRVRTVRNMRVSIQF